MNSRPSSATPPSRRPAMFGCSSRASVCRSAWNRCARSDEPGPHQLDRDLLFELAVGPFGAIHLAHAATAEQFNDAIRADARAGGHSGIGCWGLGGLACCRESPAPDHRRPRWRATTPVPTCSALSPPAMRAQASLHSSLGSARISSSAASMRRHSTLEVMKDRCRAVPARRTIPGAARRAP